jgi:hypothetical protein
MEMKKVFLNDNHIFNKIMKFNKLATVFPIDVKKVKISPEILDEIFTEFSFKFITKTSSSYKILKEIYNVYFGKNIIKTIYDNNENQNIIYFIDENVYNLYEFGKENLILDRSNGITYNSCSSTDETCIEI